MPEFLRGWEILILLVLLVLLFGAKRLPDTARGLGRSLRIFKAETKGLRDDDEATPPAQPSQPVAPREITDGTATPPPATPASAPAAEREPHDR